MNHNMNSNIMEDDIHVFVAVYDLQRGSRFTYIHVFVAVYDLHRRNRSTYNHILQEIHVYT
jgi:hypothetical protein